MLLGYFADGITLLTGKNLPVSSMRVKKFTASTEFASGKGNLDVFEAPFKLSDGITKTLNSEFLEPDTSREIFYTE